MKPFPKIVGVLGTAATIYSSLEAAGVFKTFPAAWLAPIAVIGSILALFSHSATGTGGKTDTTFKTDAGA